MADKVLLLPIADAALIGKFEIKKNEWFDPFVGETVDGFYIINSKMKSEVKKYCNDNSIPVDIDALTQKFPAQITYKDNNPPT